MNFPAINLNGIEELHIGMHFTTGYASVSIRDGFTGELLFLSNPVAFPSSWEFEEKMAIGDPTGVVAYISESDVDTGTGELYFTKVYTTVP